jgi:hypothetical protein
MRNLISAVSRSTAGLAAGVVLAGGVAGGVLLFPGTAYASPLIGTSTSIINVTQSTGSSGTTLDVFVNVTPVATGSGYPMGTVEVKDETNGSHCFITLAQDGAGSSVGTGNCDLPPVGVGTYTLLASYVVNPPFGGSISAGDQVHIGSAPVFTADSPSLYADHGQNYSYDFVASGNPAPGYALGSGAPGWLSINSSTGAVSGTAPFGTGSFTYSVVASNSLGSATAGPFTVSVRGYNTHPGGYGNAHLSTDLSCTSPVRSGAQGTCTLHVTNYGSGTAQDVTAMIDLPSQLRADFCGHGWGWGWGWFNSYGCIISGNAATENLGTLRPGQSRTLTVTFTAQSTRWLWGHGRRFREFVRVDGSAQSQGVFFWGFFGGNASYSHTYVEILPPRFWW